MYLHYTGDARAVLYLEQDQGRTLAQEGGPGRDAADQGRHSGVALACGFGVGLHDFGVRAHNRSRFEWTRFCRRCQRRRFVAVPPAVSPIPFKAWARMVANSCWSSTTATSM